MDLIICGDALTCLKDMESESTNCCITSPPYFGLRDYGVIGQIGVENTPEEYIDNLVKVFREVRRVLKPDGTLWVNIGDTYATGTKSDHQQSRNPGVGANNRNAQNSIRRVGTPKGCKTKDLIGIPWLLAFALRADGWYLRQDIIWQKPNAMPESVKDRCTKSHEYLFLLSKSERYYFDASAIAEPAMQPGGDPRLPSGRFKQHKQATIGQNKGKTSTPGANSGKSTRNKRDVWSISTKGFKGAHFAVFPEKLVEPCILAGSKEGGIILDPFSGSGTTGIVAKRLRRNFIGIEINPAYHKMSIERIEMEENLIGQTQLLTKGVCDS